MKKEFELVKAFQKIFLDEEKKLRPEAKKVICFLREEAGGRGELGKNCRSYFYDNQNRFDVHAAAFLLGKRRMFDLIIKYLALDEREVFHLAKQEENRADELNQELEV